MIMKKIHFPFKNALNLGLKILIGLFDIPILDLNQSYPWPTNLAILLCLYKYFLLRHNL